MKKLLFRNHWMKITIQDLPKIEESRRMAFYYHFKDIYDLVEWVCREDAVRALQGKKTYDTWQEGLMQIFEAVLENRAFRDECVSLYQRENRLKTICLVLLVI